MPPPTTRRQNPARQVSDNNQNGERKDTCVVVGNGAATAIDDHASGLHRAGDREMEAAPDGLAAGRYRSLPVVPAPPFFYVDLCSGSVTFSQEELYF